MKIYCEAFHSTDKLDAWHEYVEGHARVLQDFGITSLTSHGEEWLSNNHVYVITARDENGRMIGGIKVHKVDPHFKLPVELAIDHLTPQITEDIGRSSIEGAGEICGLWIGKDTGRMGMAYYLTRVAIAICEPLGIKTIWGISSPFTLNMFLATGYTIIEEYGDSGNYIYPIPGFISTAVVIKNTYTITTATEIHRSRIFSLRSKPVQVATEAHNEFRIDISYNLSSVFPVESAH
ncbi:MAG: hypothetical protein ACKVOR_00715 [Flavobacteriales bacterium]